MRPHQPHGAGPFAQELGAEDAGIVGGSAIGVDHRVGVQRRRLVDPEAVDMELVHQHGGAADEQLADHLLPEARRPAGGHVVDITAAAGRIGGRIVGRAPFVPVVDVALGRVRIVGPLGALGVRDVVVIDHVHDHGDAVAVAGADEVFELVAPAAGVLDREIVRVAVAPAHPAFVLGERHQLDRVDAEFLQVGQQVDGVLQGSARAAPGAQAVDMQLVDDEVFEPGRHRALRIELVAPELFLGEPAGFRKLR